ncbi:MAG: GerAB/ArcD/ProY family transporter [Bacillota bacterium]
MGTFEFATLLGVFLNGTTTILFPIKGDIGQDMWIAAALAWIVGTAYILMLSRCPDLPGRHPAARVVLSLYSLFVAILVARNMEELLSLTILPSTPRVAPAIIITLMSAYAVYQKTEALSRLPVFIAVGGTIIQFLIMGASLPSMNPNHLLPVFEHSPALIAKDAISLISFPFLETVVFLPLFKLTEKPFKAALIGVVWAGSLLFLAVLAVIMILPPERIQCFTSPTYAAINSAPGSTIMKVLVTLLWMNTSFIKLAVLHYIAVTQMGQALGLSHHKLVLPASVLIAVLSLLIFRNTLQMLNFSLRIYPLAAIPVQLGIPLYFVAARFLSRRKTGDRKTP